MTKSSKNIPSCCITLRNFLWYFFPFETLLALILAFFTQACTEQILVLIVYVPPISPPSPSSFPLSLSLQCFGCCPVAMQRPQQWPLSVTAHHCPRNAYLIVACFDNEIALSCLPAELFHRLLLPVSLCAVQVHQQQASFPRLFT